MKDFGLKDDDYNDDPVLARQSGIK
jgi:hypothetical protein